ncbi:hypothetical protein [Streptomyces ziwulingensis]|uniref:Secreted protein n=1 Tax=Streptomyces ziwulingensis TaxID=1045501 RepID=A0ABP9BPY9_9ACTN
MPRSSTPWFVLALAALLVAIGATMPGASGHTGHGPTSASPLVSSMGSDVSPGMGSDVADHVDESVACGEAGYLSDPAFWLAGRDRHRPAPNSDTRGSAVGGVRGYASTALPPGDHAASQLASGVSAAPSLVSLQVCRC